MPLPYLFYFKKQDSHLSEAKNLFSLKRLGMTAQGPGLEARADLSLRS
jgi:hypothetical protein